MVRARAEAYIKLGRNPDEPIPIARSSFTGARTTEIRGQRIGFQISAVKTNDPRHKLQEDTNLHLTPDPSNSPMPDLTDGEVVTSNGNGEKAATADPTKERQRLIDWWMERKRFIVPYGPGTYPDGTSYKGGTRLVMDKKDGEQVMDSFETPWCEATVNTMFESRQGPQVVVERGYGLGIMSNLILQEMLARGGEYHIIELNRQVYMDLERWAKRMQRAIDIIGIPLKLITHLGDADEVMEQFRDKYFDLIFSDTHQLRPDEKGINDLLKLQMLVRKMKVDGSFSFLGFHGDNQTGDLDFRQSQLVFAHFGRVNRDRVETYPSPNCPYARGPIAIYPVLKCEKPLIPTA